MDFSGIVDWIGGAINDLLAVLVTILPDSPFRLLDNTPIANILPAINYFVPIDFMLDVTSAWLAAILIYYGVSIIMRWIKAIN